MDVTARFKKKTIDQNRKASSEKDRVAKITFLLFSKRQPKGRWMGVEVK